MSGKNGSLIRSLIWISLIATVIVVVIIVVVLNNKKKKDQQKNQDKINQYEAEINPEKVSFTESEFENMAAAIDEAIGTFSDDEEAIYGIFMKLKSNSDLLKLQEVFGFRSAGHDLFTAIHRNLNNEEIQKINTILSQRNISIKV